MAFGRGIDSRDGVAAALDVFEFRNSIEQPAGVFAIVGRLRSIQ